MLNQYEKAIFIIGSTAVGKTKLGIDIARYVNGEIISSDSMQLYEKASLMTAKPSAEEQAQAKHHLIDFLPITTKTFTVRDYQQLALNAVKDIETRGKIPVFVGGTMYYVESMLYDRTFNLGGTQEEPDYEEILKALSTQDEKFVSSKPNPRHLRNAYNYYKQTGVKPSERPSENKLRFNQSIIIWLYCDASILHDRVKKRIEKMLEQGGLAEITEVLLSTDSNDYTKGVLQSIGYKEFEPYLQDNTKLPQCVDSLLTATMQYSKKQIRWIKNRMMPFLHVNPICTDNAEDWDSIRQQAFSALEKDVKADIVEIPKIEVKGCEVCGIKLRGTSEWEQHIKSRAHKKHKDMDFSDDEEVRHCESCEKRVTGKKNWMFHIKSRKHLRRVRNG